MAYDKIIPIKRRLDHCIEYALNRTKTQPAGSPVLETAINCSSDTAYREMMDTKSRWDKRGGVLGYHIIHSYAPGEVTPREAHDAGVEFARRLLGERYEVVVGTHLDRGHLHCHIVFNSVSLADGEKFRDDFKAYYGAIRETSNAVSRERGLSVIEPEGKGRHYAEWDAGRRGKTTLRDLVRRDMDAALAQSYTLRTFWEALERMGYQVKRNRKHPAVKPPGAARFVRLDSLGNDYSEARLMERLGEARTAAAPAAEVKPTKRKLRRYTVKGAPPQLSRRPHSFRGLYFFYLRLLRGTGNRPVPYALRREVIRLDRLTERFYFLRKYRIDTQDQLAMLTDALQAEVDALTEWRRTLYEHKRHGEDVTWELEQINGNLRPLRRELKLCACIQADIPQMRDRLKQRREEQEDRTAKTKAKERRPDKWM